MKAVAPICHGGNLQAASAGPWVLPRKQHRVPWHHRWHLLIFPLQSVTASSWVLSPSAQRVHAAKPGLCLCISAPESQRHFSPNTAACSRYRGKDCVVSRRIFLLATRREVAL